MLSRVLVAVALSAALLCGVAVALLRTDFVGSNLCAYAVATIEEATAAKVRVDRCTVDPTRGQLTIDGLQVGGPGGRLELRAARVFVHVVVRPLLQRIRLERLEVDHPEVRVALDQQPLARPAGGADHQCLPDVLDRFELGRVKVRKASVVVTSGDTRVAVPRFDALVRSKGEALRLGLLLRRGSLALGGRNFAVLSARGQAEVDLRGAGQLEVKKLEVAAPDVSLLVSGTIQDLCRPRVQASASVRLDDLAAAAERAFPGVLHGLSGSLSADTIVELGPGKRRVYGEVRLKESRIAGLVPGDVTARLDVTPARVKVERLEVPVGRGHVAATGEITLSHGFPLVAEAQVRDLELPELLRRLGLPHAWVALRTSGRIGVKGPLVPLSLAGDAALEIPEFAVLDRPYDARSPQRVLELQRGRVTTALSLDAGKIALRGTAIDVGTSHMDVEGELRFDPHQGLDLLAHSESVELDDLAGHLGPIPWHGSAAVSARVHGAYDDPRIEGAASIAGFRMFDLSLGDVGADVEFRDLSLSLSGLRGKKDRTAYAGDVELDFSKAATVAAHLEVPEGRLHDLVDLSIGLVPSLSVLARAQEVDGRVSAALDVKGPLAGPSGSARAVLSDVSLWGEKFEEGEARVTLDGSEPRLRIEQFVLRHGDASVVAQGGFGPAWQLEIDAESRDFSLSDLDMVRSARLNGPFRAFARVRGTAQRPVVDAEGSFQGGKAGKALVGDGSFGLHLAGTSMKWRGVVGTHTFEGTAELKGDIPYSSTIALRFPDLSGYFQTFIPDADLRGGVLSADVSLEGRLLRWWSSSGSVKLTRLELVRNEMTFENDGPGELSVSPEGIEIKRLALRAPFTSATLAGSRSRDGHLEMRLVASIDGRLLQGMFPDVEHAAGTCLVQSVVGGTIAEPTLLGNLRIEDGELRLRGLPISAREMNGSVSFSQDALVIDEMGGKLNNGESKVSGGIEMKRLVPQKIDLAARVSEVNVKLDNVSATVDGNVTLYGPPLEPVLGGSVELSRLKYTEDLDLERSLLDFSRRPPNPRVFAKSSLLVHYDLDVHLSRGVRIENNLARADLKGDLKVTGTSRSVGLLGSVNTVHGTAQFRGNEFQIEQGVVTFTDRQRIRPSFDLQAVTQIKASGAEDYKVRLHGFGTPADPRLTLSSEPALAEADVGFLLTFGFVSSKLQQPSFNATDSGLAIGIEALSKATGFSDEVRRFIPKNAILRDPNIDFTSDFSAATSRLEPMARFRSHLLTDKLDVKVLQTLSPTARRYRGVLAYQVSDAISGQLQFDNEHLTLGTDIGADLKFKWEGE